MAYPQKRAAEGRGESQTRASLEFRGERSIRGDSSGDPVSRAGLWLCGSDVSQKMNHGRNEPLGGLNSHPNPTSGSLLPSLPTPHQKRCRVRKSQERTMSRGRCQGRVHPRRIRALGFWKRIRRNDCEIKTQPLSLK